jgi:hypothetical protein
MSSHHLRWYIAASVTSLALLAFTSNGASLVNAAWIPLAIGITGAVTMMTTSWLRRDQYNSLGAVGHQWRAEQRLGRGQNR